MFTALVVLQVIATVIWLIEADYYHPSRSSTRKFPFRLWFAFPGIIMMCLIGEGLPSYRHANYTAMSNAEQEAVKQANLSSWRLPVFVIGFLIVIIGVLPWRTIISHFKSDGD